jgi:hypothetical protein
MGKRSFETISASPSWRRVSQESLSRLKKRIKSLTVSARETQQRYKKSEFFPHNILADSTKNPDYQNIFQNAVCLKTSRQMKHKKNSRKTLS